MGEHDEGKWGFMTTRMSWPLWQPSNETLEAIAAVVAAHWNEAKAYREQLFWPTGESWLSQVYHFTKGGKLIK
jgi:hypothetical protein